MTLHTATMKMSDSISDTISEKSRPQKSLPMKNSPSQCVNETDLSMRKEDDEESRDDDNDNESDSMCSRNDMSESINESDNGKGSQGEEAHSDNKSQDRYQN